MSLHDLLWANPIFWTSFEDVTQTSSSQTDPELDFWLHWQALLGGWAFSDTVRYAALLGTWTWTQVPNHQPDVWVLWCCRVPVVCFPLRWTIMKNIEKPFGWMKWISFPVSLRQESEDAAITAAHRLGHLIRVGGHCWNRCGMGSLGEDNGESECDSKSGPEEKSWIDSDDQCKVPIRDGSTGRLRSSALVPHSEAQILVTAMGLPVGTMLFLRAAMKSKPHAKDEWKEKTEEHPTIVPPNVWCATDIFKLSWNCVGVDPARKPWKWEMHHQWVKEIFLGNGPPAPVPSFAAKTSLLMLRIFPAPARSTQVLTEKQPRKKHEAFFRLKLCRIGFSTCAMAHAAAVLCAVWAWSPSFCTVGWLKLTAVSSSSESKDSCVCVNMKCLLGNHDRMMSKSES